MSNTKEYIEKLFSAHNIIIPLNRNIMFNEFVTNEKNAETVKIILESQKIIMNKWVLSNRITDIIQHPVQIPNGTVGKPYESKFDFIQLGWNDVILSEFEGLEEYGLQYDNESELIYGTPTQNGEFKIKLKFKVTGEAEDSVLNEKLINLIINADPKSLWKNLESDKNDPFWKADNVQEFNSIGDKHIVVSSKRGRSHANVGSFRDDDYAFNHFENTGWSVVAVSDGAGSAKASRKGSEIACQEVIHYFQNNLTKEVTNSFDELLKDFNKESNEVTDSLATVPSKNSEIANESAEVEEVVETTKNKIGKFIYNNLGGCAKSVYNKLEEFANKNELNIKELHSTLIFTLFKKYEFGYVILTFGVGDCPIGVLNKDKTDFKLMNWLDVGEFGGGTRFITMPEIFVSDKFSTRFGFKIIDDFSYLMLMTDGIYDAKFVVEANLEKLEKWHEFIADLEGNNEDKAKVVFDKNNKEIANQLSVWMDFWSPGNHDDRTLAVIF
ncbi:PP2C family serine/threonine-protein phosphatase [Flavobacterium sp. UBA7680]|uniref:PP2C family serine/threonine-protein phosphatase n=1 Tax=Flavobacterium sp. UBA7680 TaxID=1946559 RepID=UPI0025B7DCB7|nr:PP2C family serine/threonine-protein phosphatase [Flavobacterium sp. UBA7680]